MCLVQQLFLLSAGCTLYRKQTARNEIFVYAGRVSNNVFFFFCVDTFGKKQVAPSVVKQKCLTVSLEHTSSLGIIFRSIEVALLKRGQPQIGKYSRNVNRGGIFHLSLVFASILPLAQALPPGVFFRCSLMAAAGAFLVSAYLHYSVHKPHRSTQKSGRSSCKPDRLFSLPISFSVVHRYLREITW